jgi:hypothetical protein
MSPHFFSKTAPGMADGATSSGALTLSFGESQRYPPIAAETRSTRANPRTMVKIDFISNTNLLKTAWQEKFLA